MTHHRQRVQRRCGGGRVVRRRVVWPATFARLPRATFRRCHACGRAAWRGNAAHVRARKSAALTAPVVVVVVVVVRRRLPVETHHAVGKRYGVRVRQHETVGACAVGAACAFLA